MAAQIVGNKIDPLDHFTKPEWQALLIRARMVSPKIRVRSTYSTREFLSILASAEGQSDGR
jgi:hypothetical protein